MTPPKNPSGPRRELTPIEEKILYMKGEEAFDNLTPREQEKAQNIVNGYKAGYIAISQERQDALDALILRMEKSGMGKLLLKMSRPDFNLKRRNIILPTELDIIFNPNYGNKTNNGGDNGPGPSNIVKTTPGDSSSNGKP